MALSKPPQLREQRDDRGGVAPSCTKATKQTYPDRTNRPCSTLQTSQSLQHTRVCTHWTPVWTHIQRAQVSDDQIPPGSHLQLPRLMFALWPGQAIRRQRLGSTCHGETAAWLGPFSSGCVRAKSDQIRIGKV